ncbi:hypothetical protein DFJ58DRAFT_916132 [Suillus subalutaceus]|uniref:uncharacterized protein n=1 Tax=Suillus subalutaceus TaxID=48586 RepID=UPI001B860F2D|nr:uncharacterized protein DFJ58DRAFT_916132 [Suillus subalutaceus]KAG1842765.1 hypothetical protein DFJ58DRAFT_916132 [Suillus subalutaceus]
MLSLVRRFKLESGAGLADVHELLSERYYKQRTYHYTPQNILEKYFLTPPAPCMITPITPSERIANTFVWPDSARLDATGVTGAVEGKPTADLYHMPSARLRLGPKAPSRQTPYNAFGASGALSPASRSPSSSDAKVGVFVDDANWGAILEECKRYYQTCWPSTYLRRRNSVGVQYKLISLQVLATGLNRQSCRVQRRMIRSKRRGWGRAQLHVREVSWTRMLTSTHGL